VSALVDRVRQLVAPILADLRLELYDLEHVGGTLRITVDRAGGVDLDALALVTRLISRELDHNDPMPGRYTLEVTSPGLERSLRTAEHFRRAVGSKVQIRTLPHVAGDRRVHGVLAAADDDGFVVRLDAVASTAATAPAVERRLDYADVERARTVFEWGGQPKRGAARPRQAAQATSAPAKSARAKSAATGSMSGLDVDTSGDHVTAGHTKAASTTRPSHGKKGVVQP
jgi:ribosome maturation factor RimP